MAANTDRGTPATKHNHTARQTIRLLRIWDTNAAGAHPVKYNKFTPPAVYWSTPPKTVRYNTSKEPPPTPKPLMIPVKKPIRTSNILIPRYDSNERNAPYSSKKPKIRCNHTVDIRRNSFPLTRPPIIPPTTYGKAVDIIFSPRNTKMISDAMDNGKMTATDVANAFFSSIFIQLINSGTKNKPPPAPKMPLAMPANAPITGYFQTSPLTFLCNSITRV